jgi:hypothetical protein
MDTYLVEYLRSGKAWLLVGSGPSIAAGYPSWEMLAREAVSLCMDDAVGHDLKALESAFNAAKYPEVFAEAATIVGMPRLLDHLRGVFKPYGDGSAGNWIYKQMSRWPVPVYLTTNYDNEIEKHLSAVDDPYLSCSNSEEHMSYLIPSFSGGIIHLHGDLRSESGLILTSVRYKEILIGSAWEYWRTKMTSIFQMNPVIVVGHSLFDPHIKHVLEAAKKGSGVVQPVCWIAPDVPYPVAREYLEKYRIRVITYDNRDGKQTNLARLVESISDFVPPRLSIPVTKAIAGASSSPLGSNAAAPGFFVFTKLSPYTDLQSKRIEIMLAALRSALPTLSTRGPFSIDEALQVAGWPQDLKVDDQLSQDTAKQAIANNLLEASADLFAVSKVGLKTVKVEQEQFTHLRTRFHLSLENRMKRLFPALEPLQVGNLATDIDLALAGYFREGGLTLASTVLTTPSPISQVLPTSVLKFINQASAQYDDHLRRQAFSTVSLQVFLRPEAPDREYLGRVSQGFFAFHLLGVFGDAAAERLKHVKDTVWLMDSSAQIPALAVNSPTHATFRDAFSKLSGLGVRVFSTQGLFDETREHLWFAKKIIKEHGATSPDVIAAARGDVPYRKANLFLEGFVNWQAAGNPDSAKGDYHRLSRIEGDIHGTNVMELAPRNPVIVPKRTR